MNSGYQRGDLDPGKLLHMAVSWLHIERCTGLEVLRLKPPDSAHWALNAKAIEHLAPLTRLKHLVSV